MKTYLGDSVYCVLEYGAITLTTENGMGPSNTIVLDGYVLRALCDFLTRHTRMEVTVKIRKEEPHP